MRLPFSVRKIIYVRLAEFFDTVGQIVHFSGRFFKHLFTPPFEWQEMLNQTFTLGYKSFPLIGVTAFIVGTVFTMQSYPTMSSLGATAWIPTMISISIVREIGPLITALIFAGKVGSGIGAELGSMKVTEQIDAMQVSGTKPINYLVVTRVVATSLAVPLLVIYTDFISFLGSYFALTREKDITMSLYFNQVLGSIEFKDIIPSIFKSFIFGFSIGMVSCYQGYYAEKGTKGVGKAANTSVVISSFLIFLIDLIMVQIVNILFN
ncbi:MlaE family ABC transporter permease [Marinigracilibium pacificum]|uniref:ABC transporter permease n=1 Tax=Marinigracilibium pacificum TaxID=2729599 RepID=A0A848IUD3_9BACT|nr:ABC transporter permease [Marinigracilibium pacificum]NMM47326.1 ABC transporter permease [Marinigracilibium pacificum]